MHEFLLELAKSLSVYLFGVFVFCIFASRLIKKELLSQHKEITDLKVKLKVLSDVVLEHYITKVDLEARLFEIQQPKEINEIR